MTHDALENSEQDGLPASLFLFVYGDGPDNYFAYNDIDVPITYDEKVYEPLLIGREKIESGGGLDNKTLEIDTTPNASIVKYYRERQPSQVVLLTVRQGHYTDTDQEFPVVWTGRVLTIEQKSRYARISAEPLSTSMRRPGLRRQYQYGCSWVLYSTECGASKIAALRTDVPVSFGPGYIEFADGWQGAFEKAKFTRGYLTWADIDDGSTHVRTILSVADGAGVNSGDLAKFTGTVEGLDLSSTVSLQLGCNHATTDCSLLHNNINNFGGQKDIPTENPVGFVNRFY